MRAVLDFIFRFLKLDYQNMIPEVPGFALIVWLIVLGCIIASILSQPFRGPGKMAWILFVVLLPLAGGTLYCLYCLTRQDYSILKIFGNNQMSKSRAKAEARVLASKAAKIAGQDRLTDT